MPLLAAWTERCRDRWPAVDLVICWQSAAGGSASTAAGLSGLAEHQDAQLVDLRRTERARLRVDGVPLSVPLLWLVPGTLFLFAPVIASATDGLHGARVALARAVQPDGLMASFTPPVVPMLSVLDVRQVTAVVGSEQLVVAWPGALVVAADPAAADALAAKVLADTGKPAEALRSVEPERVAEQWEATLTRQANAIGRRAAAVLGQPALTRLPGSLRRLRGVPR